MFPTLVDLGFFKVQGYGLMIALGVLLSFFAVRREGLRRKDEGFVRSLEPLVMLLAFASFFGGKFFFAVFHAEEFGALWDEGPLKALEHGFVFYGAPLACLLAVRIWASATGRPFLATCDALAMGVPLAHGFGRIGCFLAGCCHGSHCDQPWAVTFHEGQGLNGVPLHPSQLYEAGGLLLLFFGLRALVRRPGPGRGIVLGGYLAGYAVIRFVVEAFRGDGNPVLGTDAAEIGSPPPGLSLSQVTALVLLPAGLALLWRGWRSGR